MVARGDVWWAEMPTAGRRPVLVLTRDEAIPVLSRVTVAPITRTVRGIPSEVALDEADGLPEPCAASFDNLETLPKAVLVEFVCTLASERLHESCRALADALGC